MNIPDHGSLLYGTEFVVSWKWFKEVTRTLRIRGNRKPKQSFHARLTIGTLSKEPIADGSLTG